MGQMVTKLETITQPGHLVWLVDVNMTPRATASSAAPNAGVSGCLELQFCDSIEAVCDALEPLTAILVVPAHALTPQAQLSLRDRLISSLNRTDLPVVVVAGDEAAGVPDSPQPSNGRATSDLPDLQLLYSFCSPIVLPANALKLALPGLASMAFTSHRQHEYLYPGTTAAEILEKKAQHDQIFQSLLKLLPVGIAIAHDADCSRMTMNPAAAQLLDVPLHMNPSKTGPDKQLLDFKCMDGNKVIPDKDLPMQIAARTGKSVQGKELQVIRGDGTKLSIVVYAVPLFDDEGHTCGSVGVLVDITGQKKIQAELTKTQSRLNLAQHCAKAGVWEWNMSTGEVIWSKEMCELMGLPADFEPSFNSWQQTILPEDLPHVLSILGKKQPFQIEYRVNRNDGALQWVYSSGRLHFDHQNKPLSWLGICIDITQSKITEQSLRESALRFRTMMDASPLGVFITDEQGRHQYTNTILQRISQMTAEQLIQDGIFSIVSPEEKDQVLAAWNQALQERTRFEQICQLSLPDQNHAWIHVRAEPVIDNDKLSGYIAKVEDITRQRRAQSALRLSQERLQKANLTLAQRSEDMEELLSITAHDLKHPVVGIQGLLSLLKEDCYSKLDEENKQNLDLSLGECDRMKEMLTRLSELGRIEQTRPRMGIASLRDVVDTCVKRYQAICQQQNITFKLDIPQKPIRMPKAILEEVLSNLIDNAIKYGCTAENCVIEITASCENELCAISVKDNGPGIDAIHHERIFRPFRRLVGSSSKAGSGLGLTAVKRLIQRIGGQVTVISAPNEGACFEMQFPIADEEPCEESCD